MHFHILTLFPDMVMQGLNTSIIGRAIKNDFISIDATDIRLFTKEKHGHVDDYPYGGGAGMVMQAQPIYDCYSYVMNQIHVRKQNHISISEEDCSNGDNRHNKKPRVIYLTPQGKVFNQDMAKEFAKEDDLIFLCGHYEGVDERVLEMIVTDPVSIGDYVLTGGELPAMVMIDTIARLVPGVLNNGDSAEFETFHDNLLEYPQYTRPEVFMDKKVPDVLLSGHHKNIEKWRLEQSIKRTKEFRPDLFKLYETNQKKQV
ncbi:MAG: tRNA (guanosine(37)-N1)-methyltransferase TrmD [Lachnospiraceae bacterium]